MLILSFCLFRESVLYCKFKMQLVKFKCNNADQKIFLWAKKWSCTVYIFLWISSVHLKTDWWRFVVNCSFKPLHASHSQSVEKRDICKVFNVSTTAFPAFLCWILTENRQDLNFFLRREQQREREREERRLWDYIFMYSSQGWLIVMKWNPQPCSRISEIQNIWISRHHKTDPGWPSD